MSAETWKPIPQAPGYEASDMGRIRSFRRGAPEGGRVLHPAPTGHKKRYRVVRICVAGKWRTRLVHQLVLEAHVGPRPQWATDVRHLNGSPGDNRLENLTWGTRLENAQDTSRHGTHANAVKTHCKRGHEFTPENTALRRDSGGRVCRACAQESKRRYKQRERIHLREQKSLAGAA